MIQINNLNKSFGKVVALKQVDMSFAKGNITGVAGRNGAGKTTLFKCIAGLEDYNGQIGLSDDLSINRIGLLEANPYFLSRITGREYLKLMSIAVDAKDINFDQKNIFDLPLDQYAEHYSTGMKKKLAFLGMLIQDNDIVILDEPFNGVDIQSNELIIEVIRRMKMANKTIILSSHMLNSLSDLCDRIYILDEGVVTDCVEPKDFDKLNQSMLSSDFEQRLNSLGF